MEDSLELIVRDYDTAMASFTKQIREDLNGFRRTTLLNTAVTLNIFEEFKNKTTSNQVAQKKGLDDILFELFCLTLHKMGLLEKEKNMYVNSLTAQQYLTKTSALQQLNHLQTLFFRAQPWNELTTILKKGPKHIQRTEYITDNWIKGIEQTTMNGQIQPLIKTIHQHIPLTSCKTLLDLGGGHGLYAIAFTHLYPHLQCTIFDVPAILQHAQHNIQKYNMTIHLVAGDYYKDALPQGFDIVFNSFTQSGSDITMIPRLCSALQPNGYLVVRRHRSCTSENPFENLEWNLYSFEGRTKGSKKWENTTQPPVQQYIHALEHHGFQLLYHQDFDENSELLIAQLRKG